MIDSQDEVKRLDWRWLLTSFALCLVGLHLSCGQIEEEGPVDEEGEPIALPGPYDTWLTVQSVSPDEEISRQPTIAIEFSTYLDGETFNSYGAARLESGGILESGRVDYWMTRRTVYFRTNRQLEPHLLFNLRWLADNLRSVTGAPLHPHTVFPSLRTNPDLPSSPPLDRPFVGWQEVEELFDDRCNQCHADPGWQLPELTRSALISTRSTQVDAWLVEPFRPEQSYLMHKLLPDYPVRRFTEQPPPWSDATPLTFEEIERIEHWIAAGAPR